MSYDLFIMYGIQYEIKMENPFLNIREIGKIFVY